MVDLRSCGVMAGSDDVASRARQTQNQSCELLQTTSLTSYKHASLNKLSSFLARPAHGSHGGSGTVPQEVCSYSSHCSHSHSDLLAKFMRLKMNQHFNVQSKVLGSNRRTSTSPRSRASGFPQPVLLQLALILDGLAINSDGTIRHPYFLNMEASRHCQ